MSEGCTVYRYVRCEDLRHVGGYSGRVFGRLRERLVRVVEEGGDFQDGRHVPKHVHIVDVAIDVECVSVPKTELDHVSLVQIESTVA